MKLLKPIILFVIIFIYCFSLNAQESKTNKEQEIKSQKIAFFTDKIGLTPDEAQVFWPIYNCYWTKKNKIITDRKDKMTFFAQNCETMPNDLMISYADQYIQFEIQLADLLNEYHKKFKAILPINKVMKIYLADYEFKTYLLKKIKDGGKDE